MTTRIDLDDRLTSVRQAPYKQIKHYTRTCFEEVVHGADVALGAVGWAMRLIDPGVRSSRAGLRVVFFIVQPNRSERAQIRALMDAGLLRRAS